MDTKENLATFFVNGHRFVQKGQELIDTAAERAPRARRVRIRFDSREYFDLLARHPKSLLTLARNVCLNLDDTVYEIYE
jgi:hypothetical protein